MTDDNAKYGKSPEENTPPVASVLDDIARNGAQEMLQKALDRLDTLRLVENKIAGQHLFCVTTPSKEHRQILKSAGITNLPRILQT